MALNGPAPPGADRRTWTVSPAVGQVSLTPPGIEMARRSTVGGPRLQRSQKVTLRTWRAMRPRPSATVAWTSNAPVSPVVFHVRAQATVESGFNVDPLPSDPGTGIGAGSGVQPPVPRGAKANSTAPMPLLEAGSTSRRVVPGSRDSPSA